MSSFTLRISRGRSYCSGALIPADLEPAAETGTDLVLTCAHFFRDSGEGRVGGAFFHARVADHVLIPGTDLAVLRLTRACPPRDLPGVAHDAIPLFTRTRTEGFGGSWYRKQRRDGRVFASLPFALSRDWRTRVRRPAFVHNRPPAVRGDSGGPVLVGERIAAVQSLSLSVAGRNLGIATVAQTAPRRDRIERAVAELTARV